MNDRSNHSGESKGREPVGRFKGIPKGENEIPLGRFFAYFLIAQKVRPRRELPQIHLGQEQNPTAVFPPISFLAQKETGGAQRKCAWVRRKASLTRKLHFVIWYAKTGTFPDKMQHPLGSHFRHRTAYGFFLTAEHPRFDFAPNVKGYFPLRTKV